MLPKRQRLTLDRDFSRIFRKGRRFFGDGLNLVVLARGADQVTRFGFVVSNKVDKRATVRNSLKRKMREVIRLRIDEIKPGFDAVLVADKKAVDLSFDDITATVVRLLDKAKLSKK